MRYLVTLNGMSSAEGSDHEVNVFTVHGAGETPQAALSDALAFAHDALDDADFHPAEPSQ